MDDSKSLIHTSSSGPPNKGFFKYYKTITIDHNQVVNGTGDHKNFPVLIRIFDSDLHDQNKVQENGNDIAFGNDTAWLNHEIELFKQDYNGTHAKLVAWVRIPVLSITNDTIFRMYYGNSTMDSRQNPEGVWDSNYYAVYHMNHDPTSSIPDSTANNYDLTPGLGFTSGDLVDGVIGKAIKFDSTVYGTSNTEYLEITSGFSNPVSALSLEMWFRPQLYYQYQRYFTATNARPDIILGNDNGILSRIENHLENTFDIDVSFDGWEDQFYHLVITWEGGSVGRKRAYLNGTLNVDETDIDALGNSSSWTAYAIGTDLDHSDVINGLIEEFRITSSARSPGWFETEYNNQYDPSSFFSIGEEEVDIIPPTYSNLIESSDPLELGEIEVITINISDPEGIKQTLIEYEDSDHIIRNHTMINIGGDTWQYNAWTPSMVDNYTYTIYMEDNFNNWNSTMGTIEVEDTTPPSYLNLIEISDPLELGTTETIQINVTDYSPIDSVLIEIANVNHTMTFEGDNIYEYNVWTPSTIGLKNYRIYANDTFGNWNVIVNNITVQDTIKPSAPILTNSPSGNNIVFDWLDGSDPSGITYYILIIDNETNPLTTPGYVYKFNITNIGSESSYYELNDALPSGKYYYFLAQIDGAGHQSDFTMGSFTISLNPNDNSLMIYIIIAVVVVSAVGSISAIIIIRKKSHKKIVPPRKKIPLKGILAHITNLPFPELTLDEIKPQNKLTQKEIYQYYKEKLPIDEDIGINIDEIKALGEELFSVGAYLEALKQFQYAKDILSKHGRNEEIALISELIAIIEGLIEEREKRLEILEKEKIDGDSVKVFELYNDIIGISKKLRDLDAVNMYQSELIQYFQTNRFKLNDIENYRSNLEHEADSLSNNGFFEKAAQIYGKCEEISQLLVDLGKKEELANAEKFRNKKMNPSKTFLDL
ncbi:MAG: LamG-like jellyroll fold domain-containing protein [Promethearchaeota archaeon]